MTWVDVAWTMMSAASLTLGLIHGVSWLLQRQRTEQLALAVLCGAIGAGAIGELLMMRSATPADYGMALRWMHVSIVVVCFGIVWFVRARYLAGRVWLGALVVLTRVACLLPNFFDGANVNFRAITSLEFVTFGSSGPLAVPVGEPGRWMWLVAVNGVLLVAFLVDALITVWRRGDRAERISVLLSCGSFLFFVIAASAWNRAIVFGVVRAPMLMDPAFVGAMFVITYDLGRTMVRANKLARSLAIVHSELRVSEHRMELAARAANIGIWTHDLESGEFWLSDPGLLLFGLKPGQSISRERVVENILPEDRGIEEDALEKARREGSYTAEYRIKTASGRVRSMVARGHIDDAGEDEPSTILRGVIADVTEQREAERELAAHRDELAHLSRVALLAELSGSLAHELSQPLTAILSNAHAAQLFLEHTPPNVVEVRGGLLEIVENGTRAGEVIRRLRALLRRERSNRLPLDVNELVHDVLRLARTSLMNRHIDLPLDLAIALPQVEGDRVQLQQVLLNLVLNAVDAIGDEGGQLRIQTRRTDDGHVEVLVTDDGCGINDDDLERIFLPFVTTKPNGMGLGLAVCASILRGHEGALWAQNNSGRGATVAFRVPAMASVNAAV